MFGFSTEEFALTVLVAQQLKEIPFPSLICGGNGFQFVRC